MNNLNLPEKPKRPLTPYFKYSQDRRQTLMKEHPDWKITQVTIQCASEWKNLDPSDKEKYETNFKREMEEYAAKYLEYKNSLTDEHKQAIKLYNRESKKAKLKKEKRKAMKDYQKPKKPIGAYMLYILDEVKSYPDKTYIQLMSELKDKWAELSEGAKSKYITEAARRAEQYQEDLKKWENKMIQEGNEELVRRSTLEGKSAEKTTKKPS